MKIPALLAVALTALLSVNAGSAAKPRPKVWVADRSPIVVAASGFAARERVVLTLKAAGTRYAKTLRAARSGRVEAEWPGAVQIDACHQVTASATGVRSGRQATYTSPKPKGGLECPQPVQPLDR